MKSTIAKVKNMFQRGKMTQGEINWIDKLATVGFEISSSGECMYLNFSDFDLSEELEEIFSQEQEYSENKNKDKDSDEEDDEFEDLFEEEVFSKDKGDSEFEDNSEEQEDWD